MRPVVKKLLIAGLLLTFGAPFVGFIFTTFGMIQSFHDLGDQGIADPAQLSHHIGITLVGTAGGILVALVIGLPMIIAAVVIQLTSKLLSPDASKDLR